MRLIPCLRNNPNTQFIVSPVWGTVRWLFASSAVMIVSFTFFRYHLQRHETQDFYILGVFLTLNLLCFILRGAATRVQLSENAITRNGLFRRISIPVQDIRSAEIASAPLWGGMKRKADFLILQLPGRTLSFSAGDYTINSGTLAVSSKKRLRDIQAFILDAGRKHSHAIPTSDPAHTNAFLKSWKAHEKAETFINAGLIAVLLVAIFF